ncbi:TPA: DUF3265 domain-containing protein [Vibrio parahaemolyticus]|nr:DUF3265 domain-containing protein [Vibrio parahaemolyticus]EJG0767719.1 DUF3265 domain-containing protein [Vibrio parahaemolyticus O5:K30]EIY9802224.1 DUF3265 domain-containing protein [Vibrio parahaemolyticus]EJE4730329.1 DUF3265 domain-containing protein [Vibrio parahaemolyticus]ELA9213902.1 DUF3265 domain-containing protein [Vibrio parahaemolyticus]
MILIHNKLFKRDSQRVAFSLCVGLVFKVGCSNFGIALLTP